MAKTRAKGFVRVWKEGVQLSLMRCGYVFLSSVGVRRWVTGLVFSSESYLVTFFAKFSFCRVGVWGKAALPKP